MSACCSSVLGHTCCGPCEHRRHGASIPEQLLEDSGEVVARVQADQSLGRAALLCSLLAQAPDGVLIHLRLAHLVAASCHTAASRPCSDSQADARVGVKQSLVAMGDRRHTGPER